MAATGKESLSVVFIPDRTAVFVVPLHAGGTHDAAVHSLNGSPRIVEDATRQYTPIVVEFDPDFMLVSMEMWRKSHDMQIPISDEFKIHFMENRRRLLEGFVITGKPWRSSCATRTRSASLPFAGGRVRLAVQPFPSWPEDGLKAPNDLAPQFG